MIQFAKVSKIASILGLIIVLSIIVWLVYGLLSNPRYLNASSDLNFTIGFMMMVFLIPLLAIFGLGISPVSFMQIVLNPKECDTIRSLMRFVIGVLASGFMSVLSVYFVLPVIEY